MQSKLLVRHILRDEAVTRGLGDVEARMIVEWLADRAEQAAVVAPTEAAGGSDPSTTVQASTTGSLAQTGTDLVEPALLGLLLVVVGGLAVWATSRRRGAHA